MYAFVPQIKSSRAQTKRAGRSVAPVRKDIGSLISDLLVGALTGVGLLGTFAVGTRVGEWTAEAWYALTDWLFNEREAIYRRQNAIAARLEELDRLDPDAIDASVQAETSALLSEMDELYARIDKITEAEMAADAERRQNGNDDSGWF